MTATWTQSKIEAEYINTATEESINLEYKAAGSLGKDDTKKTEICKDVSAFANSAGGIIIYGVKEYDDKPRKHLPEKIDPIERTQFSREWLEQVINNIRPRISGIVIHPVIIGEESISNLAVYLVEIPQSTTAHQATDHRYYKRYNFLSIPMEDYEIRDVMNRVISPNAEVELSYKTMLRSPDLHEYRLEVKVRNIGNRVINNFKLQLAIPKNGILMEPPFANTEDGRIVISIDTAGKRTFTFRSRHPLFPADDVVISDEATWSYKVNASVRTTITREMLHGNGLAIEWILFADDMIPKSGRVPLSELHEF